MLFAVAIHVMNDYHSSHECKNVATPSAGGARERLRVMPAVVVIGARQTGKSTLVQELTPGERRFLSLDDLDVADLARRDPETLVGGKPVILDEIQREPAAVGREAHN